MEQIDDKAQFDGLRRSSRFQPIIQLDTNWKLSDGYWVVWPGFTTFLYSVILGLTMACGSRIRLTGSKADFYYQHHYCIYNLFSKSIEYISFASALFCPEVHPFIGRILIFFSKLENRIGCCWSPPREHISCKGNDHPEKRQLAQQLCDLGGFHSVAMKWEKCWCYNEAINTTLLRHIHAQND